MKCLRCCKETKQEDCTNCGFDFTGEEFQTIFLLNDKEVNDMQKLKKKNNNKNTNCLLGTVKWFNDKKGFGFISDEQGNDFLVHYTGIDILYGPPVLEEGQEVSFEIVDTGRGPMAQNVRRR